MTKLSNEKTLKLLELNYDNFKDQQRPWDFFLGLAEKEHAWQNRNRTG